jgi:23S rRNA (uracil1939-C5)-methyltransferase
MPDASRLTVKITDPTFGPSGVGRRADGKVLMVLAAVPGDVVEVVPRRETAGFVEASIVRLLEPSPARREPRCPVAAECGGCAWMHVLREEQLRFKERIVEHAIRHVRDGQTRVHPIRFDAAELGYRQRVRTHVHAVPGQAAQVGFFAAGTHRIVPLVTCPVCVEPLCTAIARLARFECQHAFQGGVELVADDEGQVLAAVYLGESHPDARALAAGLADAAGLAGCVLAGPGMSRLVHGREYSWLTVQVEPRLSVPVAAAAFCQPNLAVNRMLVEAVVRHARRASGRGLELYAGHGNFTYPLAAAGWTVHAVEIGVNTTVLPAHPRVTFCRGDSARTARELARKGERFDLVVLDPPRTGAREVMPALLALGPSEVIYVSCDPNTFARDAQQLVAGGYRLESLELFDSLPQTFHVELVGVFAQGGSR